MKPYIVEMVPDRFMYGKYNEKVYYCHKREFPNIPVFGSIGDRKKAHEICNIMNKNCGA